MASLVKVEIAGTGSFAPERCVRNEDLEKLVDTSDEWIRQRTGIRERRYAAPEMATSDLALEASRKALEAAGVTPDEIDSIYFATSSPDRVVPSSSVYLQTKLGAFRAGACDLLAACSGFVYAFTVGANAIATGQSRCCLVVGSEILSRITNFQDRATCVLFGDGAGAMVLRPSQGTSEVLYSRMGADGRLAPLIIVPAGGTAMMPSIENLGRGEQYIQMVGREVYKFAVPKFVEVIQEALTATSLRLDQLDLVVPHQMNLRMIEAVAERLSFPMDRIFINLDRYGNTSSASIPLAFDEALRQGRIRRGSLVLLTAMGAGLTWGTIILRY